MALLEGDRNEDVSLVVGSRSALERYTLLLAPSRHALVLPTVRGADSCNSFVHHQDGWPPLRPKAADRSYLRLKPLKLGA